LDPLNPALPAVPHTRVLPFVSVMVISTLLKVAEIWAIASDSTTFLDRLGPATFGVAAGVGAGLVGLVGLVIGYFFVTFFLPAIARRGPFLVRALVCVRWPRTGRPRRWREPR